MSDPLFDPTDPDLGDALCRVCGEPASLAAALNPKGREEFGTPLMLCKVCSHYVEAKNIDSLIARSPDASERTDRLAEALVRHTVSTMPFQLGPEPDPWD